MIENMRSKLNIQSVIDEENNYLKPYWPMTGSPQRELSQNRVNRFQNSRAKYSSFISSTTSVVTRVSSVINIEPGSMSGSIFSLTAACMGAGTLTMPYIVSKTGLVLGPILILAGALLSYYAGMLIIKCSNLTGK
jgi:hypothetical protein